MIGAIAIGAVIYILLQVVFLGALPAVADRRHAGRTSPFTDVHRPVRAARHARRRRLARDDPLHRRGRSRPAGTGLIYTTASSRVSYGLSRNGYVPAVYERTDARGVPWVGLLTAFVVGCVCFLPFPSWRSLVGLITSASVLMYAGAPLALGVFRSRLPDAERPYRLPAAARARARSRSSSRTC